MIKKLADILKVKGVGSSFAKLDALKNEKLYTFILTFVELCNPDSIYVADNSDEDRNYVRAQAIKQGEEFPLAIEGHTYHFDSYFDQARDKEHTRCLLPEGAPDLGEDLNSMERTQGVAEVKTFLKDSMVGKQMYILFFCLGPTNSKFSIPCVQITDSAYVGHSEYILYRKGYDQFKSIGNSPDFFQFVHTAGELENGVCKNIQNRRIYMDLAENTVYSTNTQYAGNTVGLKKLALRLAIQKATNDGTWLAEHMFLMASHGPNGRKTYFTGAFPSACGKTSTAMLPGETIVGDDIAYLRPMNGTLNAVNVECGIFGIIGDVTAADDPVIWKVLTTPGEAIFSNVLIENGDTPRWLGDKRPQPEKGLNFSGEWTIGKKDAKGKDIDYAHKNSRYTVSLYDLKNVDSELDNPNGVPVSGVIYGGRDSSILPPVQEAFSWEHGIVTMGASLESETTSATLGQEGVREINPMSNIDFLSVPLAEYIQSNLSIVKGLKKTPSVFAVNYFQKGSNGKYLTSMEDKRVWVKWMELRVNGDVKGIKTPTGTIPLYKDLQKLFKDVLKKEYTEAQYTEQFTMDMDKTSAKIERIKAYYAKNASIVPPLVTQYLDEQMERIKAAKATYGNSIPPQKY